jgi:predicted PurR-regulated permease PerM
MFLFAMIPFVGTPLVLVPGSLYLLATGETRTGLLLLVWSLGVVSTVDNFIRPLFISEGSGAHILIVFIGVIGGLAAWGFLGIFLGPLVISLFVFFLDSYRRILEIQRRQEAERPAAARK